MQLLRGILSSAQEWVNADAAAYTPEDAGSRPGHALQRRRAPVDVRRTRILTVSHLSLPIGVVCSADPDRMDSGFIPELRRWELPSVRGALSNGRPYRARQIGGQADRGGMAPEVPHVRLCRSHTASRARIRPSSIIVFAQRPFQEDRRETSTLIIGLIGVISFAF